MNGHHMSREIHDQPKAFETILHEAWPEIRDLAYRAWNRAHPEYYYVIGCGSSYYAAMVAAFYHEYEFGLESTAFPSSEFVWYAPRPNARSPILLALSRSGRTSETVEATRKAMKRNVPTIAVTSDSESTMAKECDLCLDTRVPNEQSTIMTKTFTGSILCSLLFGLEFARLSGVVIPKNFETELNELPKSAEDVVLVVEDQARKMAEKSDSIVRFIYLGSGANYGACLEGALKLRETSYSASEAYHSMEFRHGPFAELQKGIQVFCVVPKGRTTRQEAALLKEIASTGADVVPITNVPEIMASHPDSIHMPDSFSSQFAPILSMIPMQMFAYYYTTRKGLNPDRPRNLTRYVATEISP